jgi:hypothetical protein
MCVEWWGQCVAAEEASASVCAMFEENFGQSLRCNEIGNEIERAYLWRSIVGSSSVM